MIKSKQRDLIMETLMCFRTHPTAEELYNTIRTATDGTVSLATVYRNLNQLVDAGMVCRISVPGEADRFDPVNDGHLHMVCEECGTMTDIPADAIPDICRAASDATGCTVTGCALMFKGLCPRCSAKA